jgi:leucyl/phenylalanyl-tRNA--protein transferase
VFFGESMFSLVPNTSKLALVALCEQMQARGGILIDCQVESTHLRAMGAKPVPRDDFVRLLAEGLASTTESLSVFSHTEAE